MRSFLGVPIVAPEGVIGAFYLTEKQGAPAFDDADQELIELLAAHAAIAITNARLLERSRELSVVSERNRLALELHDVVSQKLFSLVLTAEAAATLLDRDAAATRELLARLQALAREALAELRSLILELRPPDLERDGLCGALRKHVEVLRAAARRRPRPRPRRRRRRGGRRRADGRDPAHRPGGAAERAAPRGGVARRGAADRSRRRASCSRSATTAPASIPRIPSCARRTSA